MTIFHKLSLTFAAALIAVAAAGFTPAAVAQAGENAPAFVHQHTPGKMHSHHHHHKHFHRHHHRHHHS